MMMTLDRIGRWAKTPTDFELGNAKKYFSRKVAKNAKVGRKNYASYFASSAVLARGYDLNGIYLSHDHPPNRRD